LCYRDLDDLLAERGLDISCEIVWSWMLKFGPVIAGYSDAVLGQAISGI
jgi:transposase-like protein